MTTLAGVVVFVTTYSLILPAITMESEVAEDMPGIFMESDIESYEIVPDSGDDFSDIEISEDSGQELEADGLIEDEHAEDAHNAPEGILSYDSHELSQTVENSSATGTIEVKLSYDSSAQIPEGTELKVTTLKSENESEYDSYVRSAEEAIRRYDSSWADFSVRLYAYNLYCEGEAVIPADKVSVDLIFNPTITSEKWKVLCFDDPDQGQGSNGITVVGEESCIYAEDGNIRQITFETDSLGVIGIAEGRTAAEETEETGTAAKIVEETEAVEEETEPKEETGTGTIGEIETEATETETSEEIEAETDETETAEEAFPAQEFSDATESVHIQVTADRGAFPAGTTMVVKDVADEKTLTSIEEAAMEDVAQDKESGSRKVSRVHAVDITFLDVDGNEIEPALPIRVFMTPSELPEEREDSPVIVHVDNDGNAETIQEAADSAIPDNDVPIASTGAETVAFEADSFSVYALVYTVDFSYSVNGKVFEFSIPGGGVVSFSDLVELLGITDDTNEFVEDVESVESSSPELVWVGKAGRDSTVGSLKKTNGLECEYSAELTEEQIAEMDAQTVKAGDWALMSVRPFTSEETLTVTMKNGEQFVVQITDAQIQKTVISASGQKYVITATYGPETGIPEDAELEVSEILPEGQDGSSGTSAYGISYEEYVAYTENTLGMEEGSAGYIRLFDISIVDKNDYSIKYQPKAGTNVDVRIELADSDCKELSVVHFSDGSLAGDLVDSEVDGQTVQFEASGFSIYAIVDDGEDARIGYRFWYNDGTQYVILSTQYFRYKDVHPDSGDAMELHQPSIPGMEAATWNRIFNGWSKSSALTEPLYTLNELNTELNALSSSAYDETVIDLYANLTNVYYVTYVDVNPNNVLATEIVPKEDTGDTTFTIKTKEELLPTIDSDADLNGWYEIDDLNTVYEPGQSGVVITGDMTLYPSVAGGHWLIFNDNDPVWDANKGQYVSGGASFTPPAFYLDEVTEEPVPPTWTGYTFGGWYTTPECNDGGEFSFGTELTANTTVYAKWIPSNSQYRVIYWKQRPTDDYDAADAEKTYDYAGSRLVDSGVVTGQIVDLQESDTRVYGKNGTSGEEDQQYFTYNANKTDQSIVVKADGSSVINVYYDRQVITINFTGSLYHYEVTDDTSGELYAFIDGEYVRVYPDGNGGYETRETVTRTESVTHHYDGTRYNTTTGNDGEQWGVYNNQVVRVYRHYESGLLGYDHWSRRSDHRQNNDQRYTGTRYVVNNNGAYGFVGGSMVQLDSSGNYTTTETITETISTPYTGTVYKRVTGNRLTLKGLYGRSMYPGEWPTYQNGNTEGWWLFANNSDSNTTLNAPWNSYRISPAASDSQINNRTWNLSGTNKSSGQTIYYYGEDLNGNYTILLAETARGRDSSLTVNSEKFYGYHTAYWTYGVKGSRNELNGAATSISTSYYSRTTPLYIYYARDKFSLSFYSNNSSNQVDVIEGVPYEKLLTEYTSHSEGQKNGYYFLGWYADPSCTEPFDFSQTMPHTNVAVYGKWKMIRTRIVIDPGAENVYMGSQAKTFRLDYDERIDGGLMESATRAGYILDGWYTDPEFTNRFLFSNPVNSQTVGVDTTYGSADHWSAAREAYGDDGEAYENVRNILHLYAKWILDPDTSGYNIVYDAGDAALRDDLGNLLTTVPIDTHMYAFGEESTPSTREAPSNYNELYSFAYWEAIKEDGTTIQLYPGDPIPLSELQASETITDEVTGEAIRKIITLRAVYTTEAGDRITHITYDGDTFTQDLYPSGSREVQGKTNDGTERVTVALDKEVNQTITLPDEDDFYLNGYKLAGWSFFEGAYDEQLALEDAFNTQHPDNTVTHFAPGTQVAADNLVKNEANDEGNILYAMWVPKTYSVTVKQTIESGVPDSTFTYVYKKGAENNLDNATDEQQALTGNSSFVLEDFEYYDISGHVIHIVTPVPTDDSYDVRVNAVVTRDDGTTEILNPTASGNYPILGDVVITYTYSPKAEVKMRKRDASAHETVLTDAAFVMTPVEYNTATGRWENAGDGKNVTINSETETFYLQEGTYKITESTPPAGYAPISSELYLTVSKEGAFSLFDSAGNAVDTQIAELDSGSNRILTLYDNPIRTVTLSKTVDAASTEGTFSFKITAFGSDGSTRLAHTVIAEQHGNNVITNSIGEATVTLSHNEEVALKIPNGCRLTVEETENVRYRASYVWNDQNPVDGNVFGVTPVKIEADGTLAYTNKLAAAQIVLKKVGVNNMSETATETELSGATFTIYTALTGGSVAKDADGAELREMTSDDTGIFFSGGLLPGKYYLEETAAPAGYHMPMGRFELEVISSVSEPTIIPTWVTGDPDQSAGSVTSSTDDKTGITIYTVSVRNVAGVALPATGGPGTNLIYLLGVILIALAGVGFVLKGRRREEA